MWSNDIFYLSSSMPFAKDYIYTVFFSLRQKQFLKVEMCLRDIRYSYVCETVLCVKFEVLFTDGLVWNEFKRNLCIWYCLHNSTFAYFGSLGTLIFLHLDWVELYDSKNLAGTISYLWNGVFLGLNKCDLRRIASLQFL